MSTHNVHAGDRVLLGSREVTVVQAATHDTIFQYRDATGNLGWTDASLVDWNYTQMEFAALDSELMQDYN
jgi:hypothetical protein